MREPLAIFLLQWLRPLRTVLLLLVAFLVGAESISAAEWTWAWTPAPGETQPPAIEVCTFKYGKRWAYAIELDDGPKWVASFAVRFLAQYHYTEAPPGVPGGVERPFVGSAAVIVGTIGNNDSLLNWDDLATLLSSGWGVMNHSFDHRANDWSGESARLNDQQALEDAFWSQAILAARLPGGRAPTGAVYANGYTAYNRHDALAAAGIRIATRVGGTSPRDVLSPKVNWMDFTRSYLDEKVWSNGDNKSEPMADFPSNTPEGPATNSLVIDFTHEIERQPGSANQERWRTRLQTIEDRWGARGADTLWCAPTAEVADYVRASRVAKGTAALGMLTVSLPDDIPGSALTLRLRGIGSRAVVEAPKGGALYRQGDTLVLTSPTIGLRGAPLPTPRVKCVYEGPAVSVDFPKPIAVAGVTLRVFGNPASALPYRLAVRAASGESVFADQTVGPGWVVGGRLCAIVPGAQPITGTGIVVAGVEPLKAMAVWALEPVRGIPSWFPKPSSLPLPEYDYNVFRVATADELLAAVDILPAGFMILLAEGHYQLPRPIVLEGKHDICLCGAGGDPAKVTLTGKGWETGDQTDDILRIGHCERVVIANLSFADCRSYGIKVEAEKTPKEVYIQNCRFRDLGMRAIKGSAGQDPNVRAVRGSVRGCYFENTKVPPADWLFGGDYIGAIDMMALEDWNFSDNVFRNIQGRNGGGRAAIFIWVRSRRVVVERNLIVNCDRGVAFGNPGPSTANAAGEPPAYVADSVIRNNFIAGGADSAIELWHAERIKVLNNTIWRPAENWSRGIRIGTGTTQTEIANNLVHGEIHLEGGQAQLHHNLTGRLDSWFVDPASGNLALTSAANGAIGQGVPLAEVTEDIRRRPRAAHPDLGAWESAEK